jgi:small subunit ribosomal protein S5
MSTLKEKEDVVKEKDSKYEDRVVSVSRVSKTVKGGRRMSFSALVVVGDKNGMVGYGLGKAAEVPEAVKKAVAQAKKSLIHIPLENDTIPYTISVKYGASKLLLAPTSKGRGIVAGSTVRAIAELAGIPNLMAKIQGSRNPHNVVKAAFEGLQSLMTREEYLSSRKSLS